MEFAATICDSHFLRKILKKNGHILGGQIYRWLLVLMAPPCSETVCLRIREARGHLLACWFLRNISFAFVGRWSFARWSPFAELCARSCFHTWNIFTCYISSILCLLGGFSTNQERGCIHLLLCPFIWQTKDPLPPQCIENAHVLLYLGDSVTTDHISPAGSIARGSAAARYLTNKG